MPKRRARDDTGPSCQDSLPAVADRLVASVGRLMGRARTEEDLKIGFEKALEPLLESLGIEPDPKYERASAEARSVYRGRPDAVHGQVIIEYERPGAFSSDRGVKGGEDDLVEHMTAEAQGQKGSPIAVVRRLAGVGLDGTGIFFLRYEGKEDAPSIDAEGFVRRGPYPFNAESARTFLTHLRALARYPLTAEGLARKFGPRSEIAPIAVSAFADALEHWANGRVRVFYEEWKRLFGIVYGEQFARQQADEAQALAAFYKVGPETDFQELLFSVHTYFALLMKLIAAELIALKDTSLASSLSHELAHTSKEGLLAQLGDIEDGGVYARRGITNFLEGDFFRWYLDAFSPRLEAAIKEIARGLSEFEPATTAIDPAATRDLLKKVYQYLVPQQVRHRLGEYYTPDWLAELILNEVGYHGDTLKRLLDPACGSGTFLVLAIQRAREYARAHNEPPRETAKRIAANIWGFDLNPLAVIASRTNYLFALGDLAHEVPRLEIPIYLADSVLTPAAIKRDVLGEVLPLRTTAGEFRIPGLWISGGGLLLAKAAPLVEKMAREGYSVSEAMERLKAEGLVFPPHEQVVSTFYGDILRLEKAGKNGIWARFLKNASAPVMAGQFDLVVGNPPWIRWGYLSQEYREATLPMWKSYGLFSLKGHAARLGGGEKDFSMLFTYAAADHYLKKNGKLGFLITQEVFKSKGAGEGFRRFRLGQSGEHLKVLKAHDLVTVQPFEGAANKTAAIILKKGTATTYPVPYTLWERKKGVGMIPTDALLDGVLPLARKKRLSAQPIGAPAGSWQTLSPKQKGLAAIEGKDAYQARRGASTEPYGVFWLDVAQVLSDGNLMVRNLVARGKRRIQAVEYVIEPDLVYPAVRGADIQRWRGEAGVFVLLTQDPGKRAGYPESVMKERWPRTYSYLLTFKQPLLDRAAYKKYHAEARHSFYSQYNVAHYTFGRYKVVWKRMASDLAAAVVSQHRTPFGWKTVIPTDTTSFFPTENQEEAHYLCAIINSTPVRDFIKSFSSAGRGFGAPSVMQHVAIPKFDPKNPLHDKLADNSKACHRLKQEGNEKALARLETENDELVKKLFRMR